METKRRGDPEIASRECADRSGQVRYSAIVPTYNRRNFVSDAIDSLLQQTRPPSQIVVVDDGSTDGTATLLRDRYGSRIDLVEQVNQGEPAAVNAGLRQAKHDVVTVLSSDDWLDPIWAERVLPTLDNERDVVAAYGNYRIVGQDGRIVTIIDNGPYDQRSLVMSLSCLPGVGAAFRRSALRGASARREDYPLVSDLEQWIRLSFQGRMVRIDEPLASWRDHPNTTTATMRREDTAEQKRRLATEILARPELPSHLASCRHVLRSTVAWEAVILKLGFAPVARADALRSIMYAPPWPDWVRLHRNMIFALLVVVSPRLAVALRAWRSRRQAVLRGTQPHTS